MKENSPEWLAYHAEGDHPECVICGVREAKEDLQWLKKDKAFIHSACYEKTQKDFRALKAWYNKQETKT